MLLYRNKNFDISNKAVQVLGGVPIDIALRQVSLKMTFKREGSTGIPENIWLRILQDPRK